MYRFRDETVSESGSKGVGVKSREMDGCSTGWLWISSRRPERKATKVGRDFWLAACIYLIFEAPRLLAATWPKGHILLFIIAPGTTTSTKISPRIRLSVDREVVF